MLREDYTYARTTESSRTMDSTARPAQDRLSYAAPARATSPTKPAPAPSPGPYLPAFSAYADPSAYSTPDYLGFRGRESVPPAVSSDPGASFPPEAFGFLQYLDPPPQPTAPPVGNVGPVWQDNLVLSETHYHHGDHHHNHHQRHIHHFHDIHLLGSAEEVLDLRVAPQTTTTVLPGASAPQLRLRPDVLGRQAFEAGLEAFFSSLSTRFDALSGTSPMPDPLMTHHPITSGPTMGTYYDVGASSSAGHFGAPYSTGGGFTPVDTTRLTPYGAYAPVGTGSSDPLVAVALRRTPVTDAELREADWRARESGTSSVETREGFGRDGGDIIYVVNAIVSE